MTRRIEFPSTAWVEIREELKAADRFKVQEAATIEASDTGRSHYSFAGMTNDMRNMLLSRIITAWSYPVPIPAQNSFAAADTIIGETMDLDDYTILAREVEPLMNKINGVTSPDPKPSEIS
jgi:hypothetical protein